MSRRLARHILRITQMTRRGTESPRGGQESPDFDGEDQSYVDTSLENVLGRYYKPKVRHRLLQPPPKLRFNHNQIIVYSSLPCKELEQIVEHKIPGVLKNAHTHRNNASSTTLVRHKTYGAHAVKSHKPSPAPSHGHRLSASPALIHGHRTGPSPALIHSQKTTGSPVPGAGRKSSGNRGSARNACGLINSAKK